MTSVLPKISIVTPSYNQDQFLERTILSIIDQNYPNLEYIIIDGASTDNSLQIIKKYQKYLSFWQSKKDNGQSEAINIGFKHATGDILCWLNSDDILFPHSLNLVAKLFSQFHQINWLTSQSVIINEQDEIIQTGLHFGKSQLFLKLGLYHGKCLGFIPQEGTFWRSSLWQKINSKVPDYHYSLDYHLWQKFAHFSPLVNLETPLAAFRFQPQQKTNSHFPYYYDINPFLAYVPKYTGIIGKIVGPITRRLCPRVTFNKKKMRWEYFP